MIEVKIMAEFKNSNKIKPNMTNHKMIPMQKKEKEKEKKNSK